MDIKEFKKNAMRDALDKVHSWKQEHQDDYSHFSLDITTVPLKWTNRSLN